MYVYRFILYFKITTTKKNEEKTLFIFATYLLFSLNCMICCLDDIDIDDDGEQKLVEIFSLFCVCNEINDT